MTRPPASRNIGICEASRKGRLYRGSDRSFGGRERAYAVVAVLRMVPDVVELGAELGCESLGKANLFHHIYVPVVEPGYPLGVPPALPVRGVKPAVPYAGSPTYRASLGSIGTEMYLPVAASKTSGLTYPKGFVAETPTYCARTPALPAGFRSARFAPPIPSESAPFATLYGTPDSKIVIPATSHPPTTLPSNALLRAHERQLVEPRQAKACEYGRTGRSLFPGFARRKQQANWRWATCCCTGISRWRCPAAFDHVHAAFIPKSLVNRFDTCVCSE